MASNMMWACVMAMVIVGCGGGESGSASDERDRALARAMAFHDEALRLTLAHIRVMCKQVACPWSEAGAIVSEATDREQSVCGHGCVAVDLPAEEPGEIEPRYFLVEHLYVRPVNGCYGQPEAAFAMPYATPCLDHSF